MAYLDIITLEEAKTYLGIDDTSRDAEVTAMITGALAFIEKSTNLIMEPVDKSYILIHGSVRVYDYPINTLDAALAATITRTLRNGYSLYCDSNVENDILTLNVGQASIPGDLKQAGLMLIDFYFNAAETGANANYNVQSTQLPMAVQAIIDTNRRHVI